MPNSNSSPTTASSTPSTSPSLVDASGGNDVSEPRRLESGFISKGPKRFWNYNWKFARLDAQAGITVAAISLPQSMAYALIAGVDPRFGLYTAIIFCALGSIFGSSSHLINGPTGAVSLVVFSALSFFDPEAKLDMYEGMFLLGVMIGTFQILISVFRLGDLTRYISESIITGFMSGAAMLTIVGQVGNGLGLKNQGTGHDHVFYRLWLTLTQDAPLNWKAIAISGGAIVFALVARHFVRRYKLPQLDMFLVLLAVSIPAYFLGWSQKGASGKTAVSLIEEVPASLPAFHVPVIQWSWVGHLSSGALAIAVLSLLETLAIAKAISYKTHQQLDFNRQCLAAGIGNITSALFRGMPGAGSLSRSALNHQSGAATKASGLFTSAFVAILVLVLAPLTRYIPKAALAGLLAVAAARLIDIPRTKYVTRAGLYDAILLFGTWVLTLTVGVEYSILIGVVVSVLLFVPRAAKLRVRQLVVTEERIVRERIATDPAPTLVQIYDLEGELFFGAAPEFEQRLQEALADSRAYGITHVVYRVKRLRNPDAVSLERLEHFLRESQKQGFTVFLAGIRPDLAGGMKRLHFDAWFPTERWFYEQERVEDSATLQAVRKAYQLQGIQQPTDTVAYYLV